MYITLITERPNEFRSPFVLIKTTRLPILSAFRNIVIFDGLELALIEFPASNILSHHIENNVYWCNKENFEEIAVHAIKAFCETEHSPHFVWSMKHLPQLASGKWIHLQEDNIHIYAFANLGSRQLVYDENVVEYFKDMYDQDEQKPQTYDMRAFKKAVLLFGDEYSDENIYATYKRCFPENYLFYIAQGLQLAAQRMSQTNIVTLNTAYAQWELLYSLQDYFNSVRIYNLEGDYNYQYDEHGDAYVQFVYNAGDSITGRLFSREAGLQTLPKHKRDILKAEEGCVLYEFDFKSFEFSLMLAISFYANRTLWLNEDIDVDFHTEILEHLGIDKKHRDFGKRINYAFIYGMPIENIVMMILQEFPHLNRGTVASNLLNFRFYKHIEEIKKYIETRKIENRHYLTFFSRPYKSEKEHAELNNFLQASAADYLNEVLSDVLQVFADYNRNQFSKNKLLLQNHDSFLVQLELGAEKVLVKEIRDILDYIFPYFVNRIKYEVYRGLDWLNMEQLFKEQTVNSK
jgi:hypothetical protein